MSNYEIALECCINSLKRFKHVAKNASVLSCGHSICKECIPEDDLFQIKCEICGDINQINLDSLRSNKENYAFQLLFESSIRELFEKVKDRFLDTFETFKTIHSHEFLNTRIELIRDSIDIHVESIKSDLDFMRDNLLDQLDGIKDKISLKINEDADGDEALKHEKTIQELEHLSKNTHKQTRDLFYHFQDSLKQLCITNKNFIDENLSIYFKPSVEKLILTSIGRIVVGNPMDSLILNQSQVGDLMDLCEFKSALDWELIYRASRDGFKSYDFHRMCDDHTHTLIVIKSRDGYIFGGYTSQLWNHTGYYKCYIDEFLFSLKNPSNKSIKINGKQGYNAIYCNLEFGPTFGGGYELYICNNSNVNGSSCYRNSNCFKVDGLAPNYFTDSSNFFVDEIEVFARKV